MTKLSNPVPIFYDRAGNLLDGGSIYVGAANADPQTQPIDLFWDFAQTIPAAQPLGTIAGRVVNGAMPANVFFAEQDFSARILDSNGAQIDYSATVFPATANVQPLDDDLTAIAAAGTTPYGVGLLSLANQAAFRSEAGAANALLKSGGTMTGAIGRQSSGIYIHHSDPTFVGDSIITTDAGASDPTINPGDFWFEFE